MLDDERETELSYSTHIYMHSRIRRNNLETVCMLLLLSNRTLYTLDTLVSNL